MVALIQEIIEHKIYFLFSNSFIFTFSDVLHMVINAEGCLTMTTDTVPTRGRAPYGGIFGDSNLIRVLSQIIADPFTAYRPIDLAKLTKDSSPTVRASLKVLTSAGLLVKDERDRQHPVYRVNTESKRYLALTVLAYAVLDDRNGTDFVDEMIADYYDSELREKHELNELTIPTLSDHELFEVDLSIKHSEILMELPSINQGSTQVETCPTVFVKIDKPFLDCQEPAFA